MISCRGTFINGVIEKLDYSSYLEIGLSNNPRAPYRLIKIKNKTAIDVSSNTQPDYCMTSNKFFEELESGNTNFSKDYKWDIIFIDGDHLAEQVYLDLCNSFNHLSDNGIIFMHDSLPWSYDMTIEEMVGHREATCQDAWKVIEYCLKEREDMNLCTLEENCGGLGVVTKNKQKRKMLSKEYNRFFQYKIYHKDRFKNMNTIKQEEIFDWIKNPSYNY